MPNCNKVQKYFFTWILLEIERCVLYMALNISKITRERNNFSSDIFLDGGVKVQFGGKGLTRSFYILCGTFPNSPNLFLLQYRQVSATCNYCFKLTYQDKLLFTLVVEAVYLRNNLMNYIPMLLSCC